MTPELGLFALGLALVAALVQAVLPHIGALRRDAGLMALGQSAALIQFIAVALAFACLVRAYLVSDFTVLNVVQNSHSAKPWLYKFAGAWGNHEGSMLLWVLMLALFGALVALFGRGLPASLRARVLAVQGAIGAGFLLFILGTSNPFARIFPPPADGQDLNPLLQDPGLAFHPPFLYLGYVGFSVAFAFAAAALIEGRVDSAWARWVRPWILLAWSSLTLGIAMGSWWAYYELGWGGWWFWDPVENASFMPWLAGTALLHCAIVVEKRDALKAWTVFLCIIAFSLSLLGTFLVRSGVLTSVHAFAVDPARGIFILILLALATGGAFLLFALRAPRLSPGGLFQPISREGALVLNNLLLSVGAATVLTGTLYPLVLDAMGGGKVSVGAPYFARTFVPLMAPMVIVTGFGPLLPWKKADLRAALQRLWLAALVTVAGVTGVAVAAWQGPALALPCLALGLWAVSAALTDLLTAAGAGMGRFSLTRLAGLGAGVHARVLAHAGLGVAIIGMTGSIFWRAEDIRLMAPGDEMDFAGYHLRFEGVGPHIGPNWQADRADFTVTGRFGSHVMQPERRWYPVDRQITTEAAIRSTGIADLYLALGEQDEDGLRWVVRAWHNPLVPWIWGGALMMVGGGLLALNGRRQRAARPAAQMAEAPAHA